MTEEDKDRALDASGSAVVICQETCFTPKSAISRHIPAGYPPREESPRYKVHPTDISIVSITQINDDDASSSHHFLTENENGLNQQQHHSSNIADSKVSRRQDTDDSQLLCRL